MNEIFSFTDLLTNLHTPRTSPDEMVAIELMDRSMADNGVCNITLHESKAELLNLHQADVDEILSKGEKLELVNASSSLIERKRSPDGSPQNQTMKVITDESRRSALPSSAGPATRQKVDVSVHCLEDVNYHSQEVATNPKIETPPQKNESQLPGMISPPGTVATALYQYDAQEDDELSIFTGETLHVISKHDDGWLLVQNQSGSLGVIPGNYVKLGLKNEKKITNQTDVSKLSNVLPVTDFGPSGNEYSCTFQGCSSS